MGFGITRAPPGRAARYRVRKPAAREGRARPEPGEQLSPPEKNETEEKARSARTSDGPRRACILHRNATRRSVHADGRPATQDDTSTTASTSLAWEPACRTAVVPDAPDEDRGNETEGYPGSQSKARPKRERGRRLNAREAACNPAGDSRVVSIIACTAPRREGSLQRRHHGLLGFISVASMAGGNQQLPGCE
ncbi:hypothetical protein CAUPRSCDRAFT_11411 [Caulochytrium protostelioides]|uniref:Uncharacterized protein n=1 Tax=Caulochytrium protostelioides TaxID=1555241 RepID=A0A4P9WW37_9FUNG|nr:hypothetical protein CAUPRSCDRAFT_11411 [Caulochytrium protostelioides]